MPTEELQTLPTEAELQAILDSNEPLEIELKANGSCRAVPVGTKCDAKVEVLTLKDALARADADAARINTQALTLPDPDDEDDEDD